MDDILKSQKLFWNLTRNYFCRIWNVHKISSIFPSQLLSFFFEQLHIEIVN